MASLPAEAPADGTPNLRTHTLELRDVWRLRGVLTVGIIEGCLNAVLGHIYLPYARSVQHCDVAPTAEQLADVHSTNWSGSAYCADRDTVTADAQALVNVGSGITLALCCLVLPTYGVLADRWGRWRVIALYFSGICIVCLANALYPSTATFVLSRSLSGALGDPHPIAHAQIADVCAPDVRCGTLRPSPSLLARTRTRATHHAPSHAPPPDLLPRRPQVLVLRLCARRQDEHQRSRRPRSQRQDRRPPHL
jgi:hypothetical protein